MHSFLPDEEGPQLGDCSTEFLHIQINVLGPAVQRGLKQVIPPIIVATPFMKLMPRRAQADFGYGTKLEMMHLRVERLVPDSLNCLRKRPL